MDFLTVQNIKIIMTITFIVISIPLIKATLSAPFVPTPRKIMQKMFRLAQIRPGQVVYDLGCGDGRFIREAARKYQAKAIGIELNPVVFLYAKFKSRKRKNEEILYEDFYKVNLENADVVICYLMPKAMEKIEQKLTRELKPGCKVISHGFKLKKWQPVEILNPQKKGGGKICFYQKD